MAAKEFGVGSMIRIKGTNCEGTIKMIESEEVPNPKVTSRYSGVTKIAFAYVTLNKGMTYPTMRTFHVQTYGTWNLAKVPYEDLEERVSSPKDAYGLIKTNDITGLRLLKPASLSKKGSNNEQRHCLNTTGYALMYGNVETIKFMISTGLPLPDNKHKDKYYKLNSLELLISNNTVTTTEKLEIIDILLTIEPDMVFGNSINSVAYNNKAEEQMPLFYRVYTKEALIRRTGSEKDPWANLLDSSLACNNPRTAMFLIREGFDMKATVKRLKKLSFDRGHSKAGTPQYDDIDEKLKVGQYDYVTKQTVKTSMAELEKYAENPDLHIEIEKIKKETA